MTRLLLFVFTLFITPAMAQENLPAACKLIPDNNNVVYQPGVDVDGNAVVPADLNDNANALGGMLNIIKVPLEFDLAQRIAGLNVQGVNMNTTLGMLEIHQDGKVMYNDQDITKPVMTLCGKSHKEVTVDIVEAPPSVAPQAPIAPEFNEAAAIEKPVLPSALAVDSPEEASKMPAVSAPIVEKVGPPKISQPDEVKGPLVGTVRTKKIEPDDDVIKGGDHRDNGNYNE